MARDSDKLYELIEAWLDGKLPPDETTAFAERLEADEDLSFRVEQHQLAREVIGQWVSEDYKTKIKSWQHELEKSPPPGNKSPSLMWWITGLCLLLLVVGGIWYYYMPGSDISKPVDQKQSIPSPEQPAAEEKGEPSIDIEKILTPERESKKPEKPQQIPKKPEAIAKNSEKPDLELLPDEELIAMADEEINEYKVYLDETLKTRGDNEPDFKAGREAMSRNEYRIAQQHFERIPESSPNYTAALQLLAFTYYKEKNYAKAADYYELFAPRKISPNTDWWLIQFYQADYYRSKDKFWKKLNELIASPQIKREKVIEGTEVGVSVSRNAVYREKAMKLKEELGKIGIKEE
jgi:tetratricopeptide (TPR) repeat protein